MKRFTLALLAATALVCTASAADMGLKPILKAPPVLTTFSWTGLYLGLNAGAGWGTSTMDLTGLTVGGAAVPIALPLAQTAMHGFLGGAQLGYNVQFDRVVFGIEANGDWTNLKGHSPCLVVFSCESKANWEADLTGRIGLAFDRTLVYVKGGVAYAEFNQSAALALAGVTIAGSVKSNHWGGLLGVGVEQAVTDHWTMGIEYNHIDFGSWNVNMPLAINVAPALGINAAINTNQQVDVVKAKLNYKF